MHEWRAVLDANVLFGSLTRNTLLLLGSHPLGLYSPLWSTQILRELERNLRAKSALGRHEVKRRLDEMHRAFPDARLDPPPDLVDRMPNHRKDRHVLALAVVARATQLVTHNARDFAGAEAFGVRVQSPDAFLSELFDAANDAVRRAISVQAVESNGAASVAQLIERCAAIGLTQFAARLRGGAG